MTILIDISRNNESYTFHLTATISLLVLYNTHVSAVYVCKRQCSFDSRIVFKIEEEHCMNVCGKTCVIMMNRKLFSF